MKLVKFNTTTIYRHVSDVDYEKIKKDMEEFLNNPIVKRILRDK